VGEKKRQKNKGREETEKSFSMKVSKDADTPFTRTEGKGFLVKDREKKKGEGTRESYKKQGCFNQEKKEETTFIEAGGRSSGERSKSRRETSSTKKKKKESYISRARGKGQKKREGVSKSR